MYYTETVDSLMKLFQQSLVQQTVYVHILTAIKCRDIYIVSCCDFN
jgi:hypothetical protein